MEPLTFDQEVLNRLPLAEAVLLLLRQATLPEHCLDLFDRLRGPCYTRKISFDLFVALIREALLSHRGSARQAFEQARRDGTLDASNQAAYGKLNTVPLALSEAFLAENSQRLQPLLPDDLPSPLPACLRRFDVQTIDGKVTKRIAKRLKVLRRLAGGVLGGKGLVSVNTHTGLVTALAGTSDGHANDASLVPALVERVRPLVGADTEILWIADSQFADLTQPYRLMGPGFASGGKHDHFLIRYSARTQFTADADAEFVRAGAAVEGTDKAGRAWRQEWGWLGRPGSKKRLYVRRITLLRPAAQAVTVVSDLLDPVAYPAEDLLEAYRLRVRVEGVFQKITEVFGLERLIGCKPKGTVFQLSFCLLLYNLIQVVRSHVAAGQKMAAEAVSAEMLYTDVQKQLTAVVEVVQSAEAIGQLVPPDLTPAQTRARLSVLLAGLWKPIWRKTGNKKPRPHPNKSRARGHSAVQRILDQQHAQCTPRKRAKSQVPGP